ncbi:unnamed protein product [Adineta steineri]|uniref:G-protein coupled receptors family 1 profile domain-containing protein n=1 Tax=Adineta steineri TaxID=433720 RepID=A0A815IN67_9BILA|nr:unnamed protein product [Adineta steineri]
MDAYSILEIVRNIVYSGVLLIALVYSCLILLISRFRHQNNMFILNLCVNTMTTCIYFIIYFYAIYYDMPQSMCILFNYAFNIASIQIPFAFVAFTVHRFCVIVYHTKALFKTKQWVVICILTQWIAQFVISLPFVFEYYDDCTSNTVWMGFYTLITAVILPSSINMILNICIFIHVRKSSLRVHPGRLNTITNGINHQQSRISRRDISLLKQMIFTFTMFIIGWTPALVINTVDVMIFVNFDVQMASVYLSVICLLAVIINLFIYNHEIRRYLFDSIRRCFHC